MSSPPRAVPALQRPPKSGDGNAYPRGLAEVIPELAPPAAELVERCLARVRGEAHHGRLAAEAQQRLDRLFASAIAPALGASDPEATLAAAFDLLLRMAEWPRYLTTLLDHPGGVARLCGLIGASPWLGQLLCARPALADELLPGRYAARPPSRGELRRSIDQTLRHCSDDEAMQITALRNFKHSCVLHILALDLEGALSLDEVSGALSDLADVLIETVLARVAIRQGHAGPPPLGVLAYGKLGSREMSYASDTDIVFVHEDAGPDASPALVRLATTINRWLTTPTAAGVLYETDFRLRPYGESGLLVTSLSSFRAYQLEAAWTWEHQALTRARWIAGPLGVSSAFRQLRRDVLLRARDEIRLRADVLDMRARLNAGHTRRATAGADDDGRFDVKHSRGGIIDVEFIVQYLILRWAAAQPALIDVGDNASALACAADVGLVPPELAAAATQAFRAYRQWIHRERLRGSELVRVDAAAAEPHRQAVGQLWATVFGEEMHA